ncbi:YitT family protein [Eubacteriales bacterium OttesenSCG-928-K08]|nr:YitT family protein [Eubacteriales bacterium OttesenSCG-928-K08]
MKNRFVSLVLDGVLIVLGSALTALGLAVFTIPNNIAPGGLSGISTALAHVTGLSVGVLTLLLNIPLLIIAWKQLGIKMLSKTIFATVLLSVLTDLFSVFIPPYTNDKLLAALFGGGVTGIGMGLLLARGISTGGTDLIGLMLYRKKPSLSMGQLLLLIDAVVVLFAVIVFRNIDVALYSVVTLTVASKVIDMLQQGADHAKVIYIITKRPEAILQKIATELGRGITVLPAKGGFSGEDKSMLMTIARRNEIAQTLQIIRTLDPDAFTILSDATAVYGEGFKEETTT